MPPQSPKPNLERDSLGFNIAFMVALLTVWLGLQALIVGGALNLFDFRVDEAAQLLAQLRGEAIEVGLRAERQQAAFISQSTTVALIVSVFALSSTLGAAAAVLVPVPKVFSWIQYCTIAILFGQVIYLRDAWTSSLLTHNDVASACFLIGCIGLVAYLHWLEKQFPNRS